MSGFLPGVRGEEGAIANTRLIFNPAGSLEADGYYLLDVTVPANVYIGMGGLVQIQCDGLLEVDATDSCSLCLDVFNLSNPPDDLGNVAVLNGNVSLTSGNTSIVNFTIDTLPCSGGTALDLYGSGYVLDITASSLRAVVEQLGDDYPGTTPSQTQQTRFRIALRDTVTFTPPPFNVLWTPTSVLLRTVALAP